MLKNSSNAYRINSLLSAVVDKDIRKAEGSDRGRVLLYKKGLESLARNPLGVGLGNFRNLKDESSLNRNVGTYAHSNYIEVSVSTGVIGFIL